MSEKNDLLLNSSALLGTVVFIQLCAMMLNIDLRLVLELVMNSLQHIHIQWGWAEVIAVVLGIFCAVCVGVAGTGFIVAETQY